MYSPLSGGGVPGGVLDGDLVQGGVSGMVRGGVQPKHSLLHHVYCMVGWVVELVSGCTSGFAKVTAGGGDGWGNTC